MKIKKILVAFVLFGLLFPAKAFLEGEEIGKVENLKGESSETSVALSWDMKQNQAQVGASRYRINYGLSSGNTNLIKITKDSINHYTIKELKKGMDYYFTVTAIFKNGEESLPSDEFKIKTKGTPTIDEKLEIKSVKSLNANTVSVVFSKEVVLPTNPEKSFSIVDEKTNKKLNIKYANFKVANGSLNKKDILLSTENQTSGKSYKLTVSDDIKDIDGQKISGSVNNMVFLGVGDDQKINKNAPVNDFKPVHNAPSSDTTAPENVTNLETSYKARITDFLVTLKWVASKNTAGDLADQKFYRSENNGKTWQDSRSLGKNTTQTMSSEKPKTTVTYKVTTKDTSGNESVGVIKSVSLPSLPSTGPAGLLVMIGLAMCFLGLRRFSQQK